MLTAMKTISESPVHHRLSADQAATYHREGYLLCSEEIFPENKFQKLRSHFNDLLASYPEDTRPQVLDMPHLADAALFEWLFADEVLDLIEPITGPDIALFASAFMCKPKGDGRRVPWHEDSAYWKTMVEPMEIVTVWLAIDPSMKENGCMHVIPRTHSQGRKGFSDYEPVDYSKNVFATEIVKPQRDESLAVPCELQPNHASLHDSRIIHGSRPNTSSVPRCGYTMRYMSSGCRLSEKAQEYHKIFLARGRDLAGQDYGDPTKNYQHLLDLRANREIKFH